jgi:hypothetical protein
MIIIIVTAAETSNLTSKKKFEIFSDITLREN